MQNSSALLRRRVDSALDSLDALAVQTGWTPGRDAIRPTAESIAHKSQLLRNASSRYASVRDYVLHRIFRMSVASKSFLDQTLFCNEDTVNEARRSGEERQTNARMRRTAFVENLFPYDSLPEGTNHWVMWFLLDRDENETKHHISDEETNATIEKELLQHLDGANDFEFVWYRNPKPSVLDGVTYHVQVFWRRKKE